MKRCLADPVFCLVIGIVVGIHLAYEYGSPCAGC